MICGPQFREVIQAKDVDGMTLLHHAVNGNRDENATLYAEPVSAESPTNTGRRGDTQNRATQTARENLATITEGGYHKQGQEEENPSILIDPRSSVIRCVLDFAREKLWMPEVWVTRCSRCFSTRLEVYCLECCIQNNCRVQSQSPIYPSESYWFLLVPP